MRVSINQPIDYSTICIFANSERLLITAPAIRSTTKIKVTMIAIRQYVNTTSGPPPPYYLFTRAGSVDHAQLTAAGNCINWYLLIMIMLGIK